MIFLRKLFRMKPADPKPRDGARLFKIGGVWGDAINWLDWPSGRVYGFKTPTPQVGDVLTGELKSGKTVACIFTAIEPCGDPPDMFFATVQAVGYVGDLTWTLPPAESIDPFDVIFNDALRDIKRRH